METEKKKLERRAKALLLSKDIPVGKMDLVRSLMKNREILPEERYSAIITLIQTCPDKAVQRYVPEPVEVVKERASRPVQTAAQEAAPVKRHGGPHEGSEFIDRIYRKYRYLKFFKKRYLIHASNRLGIGIKKRLLPTPRLLKALNDIIVLQESILSRMTDMFVRILNDESIEEPLLFNYLRVFRKWMMQTPLIQYRYATIKWMDRTSFDTELRDFVLYFFSFQKLDIEVREQMLSLVENFLRVSDDLKKEVINQKDPNSVVREKEKKNLAKEKQVYEFMMLMRSFLPAELSSDDVLSARLRSDYGVASYRQFLVLIMEALVYWRETDEKEIGNYYAVAAPAVSATEWDYSAAEVKKAKKDAESLRKKRIEGLRQMLVPYEELYSLLDMKLDGRDVLLKAFEEQWKIVDRKQKDFEDIHEYDFLAFIDGCVNYFNNCFIPFIDGSTAYFEESNHAQLEGSVFSEGFFRNELKVFSQIMGDLFAFKTGNPTMAVSREEAKRIMQGKIRSMAHIEKLIGSIGTLFYQIGSDIRHLSDLHRKWMQTVRAGRNDKGARSPLERDAVQEGDDKGVPVPYYNCRITGFEKNRPLTRTLFGRTVMDDFPGGIIQHLAAFSLQLAYECVNEDILYDLEKRKELLREIKELSGTGQ